jgi:hypothetical protein
VPAWGEGYFNPWRGAPERDCRTCRYAIGRPDGIHLWCEKHRLVVVFPCGWWEREAGADQREESPHTGTACALASESRRDSPASPPRAVEPPRAERPKPPKRDEPLPIPNVGIV